ncbi:MAG: hypothetical protein KKH66_18300 [Proteobacteria bacterium]|nr:hypothetical protein [Pseudomonadota bacterium]MBU4606865.1 hypothetical protein [Pseudomonadota bacterium]MCG2766458.1 hypothetical protein [Desulfarculaceae bacterium]
MKKLSLILTALALCLAVAAPALAESRCLRVQLDGTIKLRPKNPAATHGQPGNAMTSCQTNGKFHIELIFPEKGGPATSQKNWVVISGFHCPPDAPGARCKQEAHADTFYPRPFKLEAAATPEGAFNYVLEFRLAQLPPASPITITIQCEGAPADVSDYGSNYRQLMLPWHLNKMVLNAALNKSRHKHPPVMELPPFLLADVEWDELVTLVPCENFKY